jgi:TonB family protein
MLIDSRTGAMVLFDLVGDESPTPDESGAAALSRLGSRVPDYIDRAAAYRAGRLTLAGAGGFPAKLNDAGLPAAAEHATERVEDLPEENSARAIGFKPPEFLNRIKPDYTEEADRAAISATVEARVVFRANGQAGEIEIVRWAGFGLDESAMRAIRLLKFKPATRDGAPVSVRAMVRYSFKRASDPSPPPVVEDEKSPDLRDLFKPRYVRPARPAR